LYTVMVQFVSQELKVPSNMITLIRPDTDITPDCMQSEASRQTYVTGSAVCDAARKLRDKIFEVAAAKLGCSNGDLVMDETGVKCSSTGEHLTRAEVFNVAYFDRIVLSTTGYAQMPTADKKEITFPFAFSYFSCGAQIIQVLVDIQTGEITVEKIVTAQDTGKVINPLGVEGQVVGGCVMGCGWSLIEEVQYDQAECISTTLHDYLIPTSMDIPKIESVIVEVADPQGPHGARGIGEAPMTPTAAAIANAVADAVGIRTNKLPLTPERILAELSKTE